MKKSYEASESSEDYDLYRIVEDEDTIQFITVYRSMVPVDCKHSCKRAGHCQRQKYPDAHQ